MWTVSPGPHHSYYKLIDTVLPNYAPQHEQDYFDGIDTSLPALADRLGNEQSKVPFLKPGLQDLAKDVDDAGEAAKKSQEAAAVPLLAGLKKTKELIDQVRSSSLSEVAKADLLADLETKRKQFADGANIALNITLTATADLPGLKQVKDPHTQEMLTAVPGESFSVSLIFEDHRLTRTEITGRQVAWITGRTTFDIRSGTSFTACSVNLFLPPPPIHASTSTATTSRLTRFIKSVIPSTQRSR